MVIATKTVIIATAPPIINRKRWLRRCSSRCFRESNSKLSIPASNRRSPSRCNAHLSRKSANDTILQRLYQRESLRRTRFHRKSAASLSVSGSALGKPEESTLKRTASGKHSEAACPASTSPPGVPPTIRQNTAPAPRLALNAFVSRSTQGEATAAGEQMTISLSEEDSASRMCCVRSGTAPESVSSRNTRRNGAGGNSLPLIENPVGKR